MNTDPLTIDTLLEAARALDDALRLPDWAQWLEEAEHVEVRASEYLTPGTLYVMDLRESEWAPEPLVFLVCHPDNEEALLRAVAQRTPQPTPEESPDA